MPFLNIFNKTYKLTKESVIKKTFKKILRHYLFSVIYK